MSGHSYRLISHCVLAVRLILECILVCDQFRIASYLVFIVDKWNDCDDPAYEARLDVDIEGLLGFVYRKATLTPIVMDFNRGFNCDGIDTDERVV